MIYCRGGELAARGPQRFQWPAEAFRKIFQFEISLPYRSKC